MTVKEAIEEFYKDMMDMVNWAIDEEQFKGEDLLEVLEENITKLKDSYLEKITEGQEETSR